MQWRLFNPARGLWRFMDAHEEKLTDRQKEENQLKRIYLG